MKRTIWLLPFTTLEINKKTTKLISTKFIDGCLQHVDRVLLLKLQKMIREDLRTKIVILSSISILYILASIIILFSDIESNLEDNIHPMGKKNIAEN